MAKLTSRASAARSAAILIHSEGSKTKEQLFQSVNFGSIPAKRRYTLNLAIRDGWLQESEDGLIGITPEAAEFLDGERDGGESKQAEPLNNVAQPRSINLLHRPAYKPPPKRIPRPDEPEWSKRK